MILASYTVGCHARSRELARNDKESATKVAPPKYFLVIASASEAINEQRIPNKKRAQSYGEAIAQRRFGFCYL